MKIKVIFYHDRDIAVNEISNTLSKFWQKRKSSKFVFLIKEKQLETFLLTLKHDLIKSKKLKSLGEYLDPEKIINTFAKHKYAKIHSGNHGLIVYLKRAGAPKSIWEC